MLGPVTVEPVVGAGDAHVPGFPRRRRPRRLRAASPPSDRPHARHPRRGGAARRGCATSGQGGGGATDGTITIGAPLSLTAALAREGVLTREGHDLCKDTVNAKGLQIGGKPVRLDFSYQDDKSAPDTAAQLVDQFNDKGVKLVLGPYGSATTEPPRRWSSATARS